MKTKLFFAAAFFFFAAFCALAQDSPNTKVTPAPSFTVPSSAYLQTTDNENNALTGVPDGDMDAYLFQGGSPIEFNIFIADPVVNTAQLSILAYDIDWSGGETDQVYLNGNLLGTLTGTDNNWSTTVFSINPAWVNNSGTNGGKNLVQVYIDVTGAGWAVQVDWGQLNINFQAGTTAFRYVTLDKTSYCEQECLQISEEVDANPAMSVRVESQLLDPANNAIAQDTRIFTATSGDEPFSITSFCLPANPTPGTWKVQAICYDAQTNVQQDIRTVTFTVTNPCNPNIPTLTEWGLIFLGIVLLAFGTIFILRRGGGSA